MAHELSGMCWLIDFPSPSMQLVMMKICDCADENGTNIFPSVATIQRETSHSPSTIREAIAAFEEAGLLIVKANRFGNSSGNTTVLRELDTDKLRLVTGQRRKGKKPYCSTHILRRGAVEIAGAPDAKRGDVAVVFVPGAALPSYVEKRVGTRIAEVMAIFARPRGEVPVGYDAPPGLAESAVSPLIIGVVTTATPPLSGGAPLQPAEGHPSAQRSPPLRSAEETPPLSGANPSLDPSPEEDSPPPPRQRRGAREDMLLDEVRSEKPACGRAFDKLLVPLLTRLPLKAPKPKHALGALADLAEAQQDDVLAGALSLLTTPGSESYRKFDVRPTNIEDAIAEAARVVSNRSLRDRGPLLWRGTAAFDDAIAKVKAAEPQWAWELSQRQFIKRSDLKAYGVEQVLG